MKENVRNFLDREGIRLKTQTQMQDFWAFRKMITPVIIRVLFWAEVLFVLSAGCIAILEGVTRKEGLEILIGVSIILFGPFVIRMQCEMIVVLFRINESLDEIKKNRE